MGKVQLLFLLFLMLFSHADTSTIQPLCNDQFELHLGIDKDGGFIPSFRVPFQWDERISSTVRFSQSMNTESGTLNSYTGRKTVQSTVREIDLTLFSYRFFNNALSCIVGIGGAYERIERQEFGSFFYSLPINEDVAFENRGNIRIISPILDCGLLYKSKRIFLDIQTHIKPVNFVYFEQDVLFKPLVGLNKRESRTVNKPIVTLSVAPYFRIGDFFWIGWYGLASYMDISYTHSVLAYIGDGNSFTYRDEDISLKELALSAEGRIGISRFSIAGSTPFVGGGAKYVREDLSRNAESGTIPYFTFGLEVFK